MGLVIGYAKPEGPTKFVNLSKRVEGPIEALTPILYINRSNHKWPIYN